MTGYVYFYNMTNQSATVVVNGFLPGVTIAEMPSTPPYTPNVSHGLPRYNGPAQAGQFGIKNTVMYQLSGQTTGEIAVNVDVDFTAYPITMDILIYLFYNSIVVAVDSDNNAYLGRTGTTISIDPADATGKI